MCNVRWQTSLPLSKGQPCLERHLLGPWRRSEPSAEMPQGWLPCRQTGIGDTGNDITIRDVNRNPVFGSKTETGSISLATGFQIYFSNFYHGNYIKITKCQIKLIHTFVFC